MNSGNEHIHPERSRPGRTISLSGGFKSLFLGGVIGKLSGIAREGAMAALYGTSNVTAAFRIGQTSTLIPLNLMSSEALNSAFLPIFGRYKSDRPDVAANFYASFRFLLISISIGIATLLATFPQAVTGVLAGALTAETRALANSFIRVMAGGAPFFIHGAITSFYFMAHGHFRPTSLRSTLLNVGLLLGLATAWLSRDADFLAWGFVLGCGGFSIYASWFARKNQLTATLLPSRPWRASIPLLRPFWRAMKGLIWLPVIVQASEAFERFAAASISTATVAASDFANFITDTCVNLLAMPLGLAGLALLSTKSDPILHVRSASRAATPIVLFAGAFLSLVLAVRPDFVVGILYGRGNFNSDSVALTAEILSAVALGLWAHLLGWIYIKNFSATLKTLRVAAISAAGIVVGIGVMAVGAALNSPYALGLSGTASALTSLFLAAREMSIVGFLAGQILRLVPGGIFAGVPLVLIQSNSLISGSIAISLSACCWLAWICIFADSRAEIRRAINAIARKHHDE